MTLFYQGPGIIASVWGIFAFKEIKVTKLLYTSELPSFILTPPTPNIFVPVTDS